MREGVEIVSTPILRSVMAPFGPINRTWYDPYGFGVAGIPIISPAKLRT
jgi:hypothetical protein